MKKRILSTKTLNLTITFKIPKSITVKTSFPLTENRPLFALELLCIIHHDIISIFQVQIVKENLFSDQPQQVHVIRRQVTFSMHILFLRSLIFMSMGVLTEIMLLYISNMYILCMACKRNLYNNFIEKVISSSKCCQKRTQILECTGHFQIALDAF